MKWEQYSCRKIIAPEEIEKRVAKLREGGKTIATLNGSFDLLHAGHLYILFEASLQADILIVALNSDLSIQNYKGKERPIIPLNYRLQMLNALECVDYLTWFDESDPCAILSKIKPDVHVNGSEYGENCIEKKTVLALGGRIHLVNRIEELASSDIIRKIQKICV